MATAYLSLLHDGEKPHCVAGIDEAGRGCLAGPVVAGAVVLRPRVKLPGLTDSKLLSAAKRETLAVLIKQGAVSWGVGVAWPEEIDRINILQATFAAMRRAAACLSVRPDLVLVDGNKTVPELGMEQQAIVRGDLTERVISAASILAKTFRDRILAHLDHRYPGYGLAVHKGYGTRAHLLALKSLGPCRMHRLTFRGVLPERPSGAQDRPGEEEAWLPGI